MLDKIRKWKDEAAKNLRKKKYAKALQFCEKVLCEESQDFSSLQNTGYILRKLDRPAEAVDSYVKLVEAYAQQGFLLRAIATCKVVLEIDPGHQQAQRRLADLYAMQPGEKQKPSRVSVMMKPDNDIQVGDQAVTLLSSTSYDNLQVSETDDQLVSIEPATSLEVSQYTDLDEIDFDVDIDLDEQEAQTQKIVKTLPEIPLFSRLDRDAFVSILERMNLIRVKPDEWIIHEGEEGNSMFAIARGSVRVLKQVEGSKQLQLAVLGEGAFFGEMSILRKDTRGASVQAMEPVELFEVSKELLDSIMEQHPEVKEVLAKFIRRRLLRNVLHTSALFKPFSHEQKVQILERFLVRDVNPGEELIREGERSNGLFVVLRGRMDVLFKMSDGSRTRLGTLEEGEVFGEISCLYREPAVASVRVATQASVMRLPREDFQELVLSHPQVLELAAELGEKRLALTTNALAKKGILI